MACRDDPDLPGFDFTKSTLQAHWDGHQWTVYNGPNQTTSGEQLQAAARIPGSEAVWAVGYEYSPISGDAGGLVMRCCG